MPYSPGHRNNEGNHCPCPHKPPTLHTNKNKKKNTTIKKVLVNIHRAPTNNIPQGTHSNIIPSCPIPIPPSLKDFPMVCVCVCVCVCGRG